MTRALLGAAALLVLSSCTGARKSSKMEGRYSLGAPGSSWSKVKPGGADQAWFHEGLSAAIYADSNCLTRHDDRPLSALAGSLVFGIATSKPTSEKTLVVADRDALQQTFDGRLDGVDVRIAVTVFKKDICVYDLLYIAPPTTFDSGLDAFEQVVAGFQAQG